MSAGRGLEARLDAGFAAAVAAPEDVCRIPGVGTDPAPAEGMAQGAARVPARLARAGFGPVGTGGHPVVLADRRAAPGAPTILAYGHHDVQPPDPLEGGTAPPFEPAIRDGRLYARGASDDEGPLLIPILAMDACRPGAAACPSTS